MERLAGTESVSVMKKHFMFRVETGFVVSLGYENAYRPFFSVGQSVECNNDMLGFKQ
jgi:hypothetical protein